VREQYKGIVGGREVKTAMTVENIVSDES